jgi:hypothetical protein
MNVEATMALIQIAADMMQCVWIRGRERHLAEASDDVYRPAPPETLFEAFGISGQVLVEMYQPLAAGGEQETLIVTTSLSDSLAAPEEPREK